MVAACKQAQWRGLAPESRSTLEARWDRADGRGVGNVDGAIQHHVPLWMTYRNHVGDGLVLISLKDDCLPRYEP